MPNGFQVGKFVEFADKDSSRIAVDKTSPTEYKGYDQSRPCQLSFCPGPHPKYAPTLTNPMELYLESSYQP